MASLVGLVAKPETVTKLLIDVIGALGPSSAVDAFKGPLESVTANSGTAGVMAIVGVVAALWAASGYVGAFHRGVLATAIGGALGLGDAAVTAWQWASGP